MRIKEIGFSPDAIWVIANDSFLEGYWGFGAPASELKEAIAFIQEAENTADFQPQLDRLLTAKRLFDEGFALLKELR